MNYIKRKLKHLNNITEFDINGEVIVNGVAANLNNLTITNASALAAGQPFTCILKPNNGWYLPQTISIIGTSSSYGFKYDYTTGVIYIAGNEIIGPITIVASASSVNNNKTVSLNVKKMVSNTYANETEYTNESFILLNIFPTRGSNVSVTYGGLTKNITADISTDNYDTGTGTEVFFGTFKGQTDDITTPDSGVLTIQGAYESFSLGDFAQTQASKSSTVTSAECLVSVNDWGAIRYIPVEGFLECTLTSITNLPNTLKSIDSGAFNKASNLTELIIPSSVDIVAPFDLLVANGTFQNCVNLTSLVLSENMGYNKNPYTISPFCFSGCSSLTTLNIPSGIKKLECSSFAGCTSLTTVNIPDTLENICPPWVQEIDGIEEEYYLFGNAFQKDVNLKTFNIDNNNIYFSSEGNILYNKEKNKIVCYPSVTGTYTIPSTIKTIEKLAFSSTLIEKVIIPESVTLIDKFAFSNCANLIEVNIIGDSITSILDGTFKSCSTMTKNNILQNNNITSIGESCFQDCKLLPGDISFPQLTELKKYAFDNCTSLTSITSLGQITSIEDYCFRGCSGLSSITIPSTVTTIKSYGFADCTGVSSITIPSDVTSIGEKAFQNVTSIKIKAMTPPSINSDTFTSGKITSITVPVGTGAAYKAATNWSSFADIIVEGVI